MKNFNIALVALIAGMAAVPAIAADIAGAKDPAFLQRFQGSQIVNYISRPYDQYTLSLGDAFSKKQVIEGQVTRIVYHIPKGHSVLEVVRNYEGNLEAKGFHRLYEHPLGTHDADYLSGSFRQSLQTMAPGELYSWTNLQEVGGVVEKGVVAGHDTTVVILLGDYAHPKDFTFENQKAPVTFGPSELAVVVDVVSAAKIPSTMSAPGK